MKVAHTAIQRILFTAEEIQQRVAELGAQISADYAGKDLALVCVLRGALVFLSDLLRVLPGATSVDFISIASYGSDTRSTGVVRIIKDLEDSVESRHVLVVEDILDTGLTLNYLLENLRHRNAASVRVCVLLDKPSRRRVPVSVDYKGFEVPNSFVVGYGLDHDQKYRGLPFIGVLKPEIYGGEENRS